MKKSPQTRYLKSPKILTSLLACCMLLVSCSNGDGTDGNSGQMGAVQSTTQMISGVAQKGMFVAGTEVTAWELDENGQRTGASLSTLIEDSLGSYSLSPEWTGWTEIQVQGRYFDEFTGQESLEPISLMAMSDIESGDNSKNINLFTHLQTARVQSLIAENVPLDTAAEEALEETQSLLGIGDVDPGELDLTQGSGENAEKNAALLLFSGAFLAEGGGTESLERLSTDFSDDGETNGVAESDFNNIGSQASNQELLAQLTENLASQGIEDAPNSGDVPEEALTWVNANPVAEAGPNETHPEKSQLSLSASGSSDSDGNIVSYSWTQLEGAPVTLDDATSISPEFTAPVVLNGASSELVFQLTVTDDQDSTGTDEVRLTITPENELPTVQPQTVVLAEDSSLDIAFLGMDNDGDSLGYSVVTAPSSGILSVSQAGPDSEPVTTYTPNANFNGSDSFTYKANDGVLDSTTVAVSITVNPVNDAPVATAITQSLNEDASINLTLSGTDLEGDTLSYALVTQPVNGSISGNLPNLIYTPSPNFVGTDGFIFAANDGAATSAPVSVALTVTAVNDAPTANAQTPSVDEDSALPIILSGADIDGDSLTYSVVGQPASGILSGTAPNLTYTPNADFNGTDSFSFKANDSSLDSAAATVSITVNPVNDSPTATAQAQSSDEDSSLVIQLAGNDIDGDTLNFSVSTQPTSGMLSGAAPNLTYTPNADFNGTDSFTFVANDGSVDSTPVSVDLSIAAVNDAPTASAQAPAVDEDNPLIVTLSGDDIDGDSLTFDVVSQPTSGVLTGAAPNLTYTPNADFNGSDSFTFKTNDSSVDSAVETVSITVNPVNDNPTVTINAVAANWEGASFDLVANGSDVDGDPLTYSWQQNDSSGIVVSSTGFGSNFNFYAPEVAADTVFTFDVTVNDGNGGTNVETVEVAVNNLTIEDPVLQNCSSNSPSGVQLYSQSYYFCDYIDVSGADFEELNKLPLFNHLSLSGTNLTEIPDLSALTGMTGLSVNSNQITDLSPLTSLANLTSFNANGNQISDLSPLSGLTNITSLSFNSNEISDISPILGLSELTSLDISYNQSVDISGISSLTKLENLFFFADQVSDLSPVSGLTNLVILGAGMNQISDLSPVSGLAKLQNLNVDTNQISDLSPISGLLELQVLELNNNQISDLSPISDLTKLQFLNASFNQVVNLSPVSALTELISLGVASNQISDVSVAASLNNLQYLEISSNQVSRVAPLASLTQQLFVSAYGNCIEDASTLPSNITLITDCSVVVEAGSSPAMNALLTPNGGEFWKNGQTQTVSWDTSAITGSEVNLYVLHDSAFDLLDPATTDLPAAINSKNWFQFASAVPNTGSHSIDPAIMSGTGNQYLVLIVSASDKSIYDVSDAVFSLNDIDPVGTELVIEGDFEAGAGAWTSDNGSINIVDDNGNNVNSVTIPDGTATQDEPWNRGFQQLLAIRQGSSYTINFSAKSDRERDIFVGIGINMLPWSNSKTNVELTAEWKDFEVVLNATDFGGLQSRVFFELAGEEGLVMIDDISVVENSIITPSLNPIDLPVNFEGSDTDYTLTDFDGTGSVLISDPLDPSNTVVSTTKSAGAQFWAGTTIGNSLNVTTQGFATAIPFTPAETTISVRVYSPDVGIPVRFKVERSDDATISAETEILTTAANVWETMVFDLSNVVADTAPFNSLAGYDKATIFFNFGTSGVTVGPKTYLWDDVTFGGVVAPPLPPSVSTLLIDYDGTGTSTHTDFGGNDSSVVTDPVDPSNTVTQSIKTAGALLWAGTTIGNDPSGVSFATPIFTVTDTVMTVRVFSPDAEIPVRLKLEDATDQNISVETEAVTTEANTWETLVFDFSNQVANTAPLDLTRTYNKGSIFFNFGTDGAMVGADKTYYWDDVQFGGSVIPVTPPVAPPAASSLLLVDFEDSSTRGYADFGGNDSSIVLDPTDPTNTVVQSIKTMGALMWAGTTVGSLDTNFAPLPFTASETVMTVRVYSPDAGIPVLLKIEDASDNSISVETTATTTVADAWETLTFDFSTGAPPLNIDNTYNRVSIFFNFGTDGATVGADKTYYWDDVQFVQ